MADNYSFRSSVNGFNRNDVITYIGQILAENEKQKQEIALLEEKLQSKNEEVEKISAELNENKGKCETCDIAKVYEARLGAAMLDAKRFSEVLVKEANDTAYNMLTKACSAAGKTSEKADCISEEIKKITVSFNDSFNNLFEQMSSLSKGLKEFIGEIDTNSKQFVFATDFADEKTSVETKEATNNGCSSVSEQVKEEVVDSPHGFNVDFSFLNSDEPIKIKVETDE